MVVKRLSILSRLRVTNVNNHKPLGLMLVDLVVVVVVVTVLLATVMAQFWEPTTDAQMTLAEYKLATMRGAIETYKAQHAGQIPTLGGAENGASASTGQPAEDGGDSSSLLRTIPQNPFTGSSSIKLTSRTLLTADDVTADNSGGWQYNPSTGQLFLDSVPGFDL